jgi:hypothetical protein
VKKRNIEVEEQTNKKKSVSLRRRATREGNA